MYVGITRKRSAVIKDRYKCSYILKWSCLRFNDLVFCTYSLSKIQLEHPSLLLRHSHTLLLLLWWLRHTFNEVLIWLSAESIWPHHSRSGVWETIISSMPCVVSLVWREIYFRSGYRVIGLGHLVAILSVVRGEHSWHSSHIISYCCLLYTSPSPRD